MAETTPSPEVEKARESVQLEDIQTMQRALVGLYEDPRIAKQLIEEKDATSFYIDRWMIDALGQSWDDVKSGLTVRHQVVLVPNFYLASEQIEKVQRAKSISEIPPVAANLHVALNNTGAEVYFSEQQTSFLRLETQQGPPFTPDRVSERLFVNPQQDSIEIHVHARRFDRGIECVRAEEVSPALNELIDVLTGYDELLERA